ncbi:MAG: TRAP transporter large permease [Phycisphaeraceae bacterium]|nr:TRAP transporter large permease [Phycisphaeraceae bacterium]
MIALLFIVFFVTLCLGVPVAFALGLASLAYVIGTGVPLVVIPQKMYAGIDVFVLLCIPGFILAGNLMNASGITSRIIALCNALVGHLRGGLGLANVGASMLFAGISGTAVSDTASIGSVMIPAMKEEGYETDFACAVTASSSTVGPIIPPSLPMIIAGTLTGLSVGKLFLASAIPGVLLGLGFMVTSGIISQRKGHPKHARQSIPQVFKAIYKAIWALGMPVIILVGILGGFVTPTEASIGAVLYALGVGTVIYRSLTLKTIYEVMLKSAITTASLMVLVGFANCFSWILASEQVPQTLAQALLALTHNKILMLLLINLLLLFVGTFMETIAALIILFPVLLKVAVTVGVDPLQFAVIAVLNLVIGLTTPPVGVCLFVAAGIGKISLGKLSRAVLPFLAVSLLVLFLVTYVPAISLTLPQLLTQP